MRRSGALLLLAGAALIGQTGRDAYRQAYDEWRQAHATLERDSGAGGPAQVAQADRAAAAAATYQSSRAAYLKSASDDAVQRRAPLQNPAVRPATDISPASDADLPAAELKTVTRTIATFANDRDTGIQQLRQSLERERGTLVALTDAIQARQKTVTATSGAVTALEQARAKTVAAFADQAARFSEAIAQQEKEAAAWAGYYEKLTQAIQAASAPPTAEAAPAPPPRTTSVTPLPLARYVGAWTYPAVNGVFHGAQPEFVDLVVHEQDGHADGTLFARFNVPAGSTTDPLLRFDFEGDFGPSMTQRFTLMTSDKAQGAIELIPGPAFNLLEVNFQTDPQANKIRVGNFILVKK